MTTIISPSLLSADFLNLKSEISAFDGGKSIWFHLDIMDGHFVPNLTFGPMVLENLKTVTKHKLDAHFMVTNPADYVEWFKNVGLTNFTFHWEAVTHHDRMIKLVKESYKSVGVSLNPSTPVEVIPDYLLKEIDLILIMSVNPGFGGQRFLPSCLDKIKKLSEKRKKLKASFQIQVDGGINNKNAVDLIKAGANNLVAGSYIFKNKPTDYLKAVNSLRA